MNPATPGKLIVFEGIDGTGKSTQVRMLAEALRGQGLTVVTSREPTDGPFGQKLRRSMIEGRLSPEEELQLFEDDRRDHAERLVLPALARGEVVVLDRYYFSTMAYQGARGFDPAGIRERNEAFAPVPDAVLVLELPVETALERIGVRDGAGNAFEKQETLEACARIFDSLRDSFVHRIDANRPPGEVHGSVREALAPFFGGKAGRRSSLERFIDGLMTVGVPGPAIERYRLGFGLVWRQVQKVRSRVRSEQLPVSGFRNDLVAYGQNGELYRHLYFHIGCHLMGWPGMLVSLAMHRVDVRQAGTGRQESKSEVLDNLAAKASARAYLAYLKGRIPEDRARAELRRILGSQD